MPAAHPTNSGLAKTPPPSHTCSMNLEEEQKRFEAAGIEKVRMNIAAGLYRSRRAKLAREWARQNELEIEAARQMQIEPARQAWYEKPFGIIVLGLAAGVIVAVLLWLLGVG